MSRYSQYKFHEDASHGWLEVPLADVASLGVCHEISPYSYMHRRTVYLEEDRDMWVFLSAIEVCGIKKPERIRIYQEESFVRKLTPYSYDKAVQIAKADVDAFIASQKAAFVAAMNA